MSYYLSKISDEIKQNKVIYLCIFFVILTGIIAGFVTGTQLDEWLKDKIRAYLLQVVDVAKETQLNFFSVIWTALKKDFLLYALLLLCSFQVVTIPLSMIGILIKGFFIGFSFAIITISSGWLMIAELLSGIILLPCLMLAQARGMNNAISLFKMRNIPSTTRDRCSYSMPVLQQITALYLVAVLGNIIEILLLSLTVNTIL